MGLLWNHLPYSFAMEAFELDPKREGHSHTKYLDAKAKVLSGRGLEGRDYGVQAL